MASVVQRDGRFSALSPRAGTRRVPLDPVEKPGRRHPQDATERARRPARCKGFSLVAGVGFEPTTFGL